MYKLITTDSPFFQVVSQCLQPIKTPCILSQFQFLDYKPIEIDLPTNQSWDWEDLICREGILLISEKMNNIFEKEKIDYLFYKKIILKQSSKGIKEVYWLALPEKIHCLDANKSFTQNGLLSKIHINPTKIGRYEFFKIASIDNYDIIISQRIQHILKQLVTEEKIEASLIFTQLEEF